ncbi:MAG: MBL fold metallo-hydrolase [Candidatus Lokiarchaeota archaeon]|nr:MBL fold metallo-hydrolase [Candidatus Lokiarchaeota archaeon]MBD3200553.1 MBL fold metallo-hydrolase [Candidatus Lokiarchaeota archaeon]
MILVRITVLVDDLNGANNNFECSYGFSALIEIEHVKILFDTGTKQKPLLRNLNLMGCSPKDLSAIVLSHNHFDHTDGLPIILKENPEIPVYVNNRWDEPIDHRGIKVPLKNRRIVENGSNIKELNPNFYITDTFYSSDYGGVYEQACYIKKDEHLILICGCCHPGLTIFLQNRRLLNLPNEVPLSIMGGLHGFKFTKMEANKLYPRLNHIILFHCTSHIKTFQKQFKEKCSIGIVGKTYEF